MSRADGKRESELGLRSDRRCLGKSRPSSIGSDCGQRPPSPWPFSRSEAQANRFVERLYPLTPGRFDRDGLLHGGSSDAQRIADVLCAFLHSLGDSPSEPSGIHAVPGPGLDGAAGSKPDDGAVGMPERLPLSAAKTEMPSSANHFEN